MTGVPNWQSQSYNISKLVHSALKLNPAAYLIPPIAGVVDAMNPPNDLSEPALVSFEAPKLIGDANGYCSLLPNHTIIPLLILIRLSYNVFSRSQILLGSGGLHSASIRARRPGWCLLVFLEVLSTSGIYCPLLHPHPLRVTSWDF